MTTNPDYEPLPLEASPMGQVAEELRPHLKAAYAALDSLGYAVDWIQTDRGKGDLDAVRDAGTELVRVVLVLDTELRRRVG